MIYLDEPSCKIKVQNGRGWKVFRITEMKDFTVLQLAIACLVIALILAVLGFGGMAGSFVGVAKVLFVIFLVLAVLSFLFGGPLRRSRIG
jgi:uncharacterized membrane protein YtjA (UPF0391 family)